MRSLAPRYLVAAAAFVVALSCGDVPSLAGGIAYVTPIMLPSPSVAAGDVMRDSLGNPAPLRVLAYDINNVLISNVAANYVVTSLPAEVTVDSSGNLTAFDSVSTVTMVARVGSRIQTTPATLFVVPQPDSVVAASTPDSLTSFTKTAALTVTVTGTRGGVHVPVQGIIVHYRITKINNLTSAVDTSSHALVDGTGNPLRADIHQAVDTTGQSGTTPGRFLSPTSLTGVDSIVVEVRANSLKGIPLGGSPVRFVLPVKKGS